MRRTITSTLLGLSLALGAAPPALAAPPSLQFRIITIHTDHVKIGVGCPAGTDRLHVTVRVWQEHAGDLTIEEGTLDVACPKKGLQVVDLPIADEWSGESLVKGTADVVEAFISDDEDLYVDLGYDPMKIRP